MTPCAEDNPVMLFPQLRPAAQQRLQVRVSAVIAGLARGEEFMCVVERNNAELRAFICYFTQSLSGYSVDISGDVLAKLYTVSVSLKWKNIRALFSTRLNPWMKAFLERKTLNFRLSKASGTRTTNISIHEKMSEPQEKELSEIVTEENFEIQVKQIKEGLSRGENFMCVYDTDHMAVARISFHFAWIETDYNVDIRHDTFRGTHQAWISLKRRNLYAALCTRIGPSVFEIGNLNQWKMN
jgi:tRNA threonylcarbamoyladenosine modification (KEOPS) complex Cgi121 subunit